MGTRYTCKIQDGITFEKFAMGCARAFGACIDMKDDPSDKEIPEFEPSKYNEQASCEARQKLCDLEIMSIDTADKRAKEEFDKAMSNHNERIKEKIEMKEKYGNMLVRAQAWNPPTKEHSGLRDFMIQQIEDSIKFDCDIEYDRKNIPERKTTSEWLEDNKDRATRDIEYYDKEQEEEIARVQSRNEWVKQLRNSL